jgi:penicillin amidase
MRSVLYAVVLSLAVAVAAACVYVTLSLPRTEGVLEIEGAPSGLRIERDVHGIPTIRAGSFDEAMFGLGFAHAQDRLWQMETHRRIAAGRLAEAFGPPALDSDRFLRTLGVRAAAAAQWERLQGEARSAVVAYTNGVNAWIEHGMRARPPEFVLLGIEPEAWEPADTMGWLVMMAWDLSANWSTELLRMRLALKMPIGRVNELMPPYPGDRPLLTTDYAAWLRDWQLTAARDEPTLGALAQAAPPSGVEGTGSNNWVLAGSRTQSGHPLLANDPHLRLSAPALWYLARIEVPGHKVAGATMPGVPLVILGQNEHVAWGFTNTATDVQDLYLERVTKGDPGSYDTPTGPARFESAHETIRVKGAPDVRITVRRTRHGPVISDAGAGGDLLGATSEAPGYAISMRWLALDPDPGTLEAGLAFNKARSVDEFVAASARYVAPMQNILVADRGGRIAFVAAGRVPLRRADNALKGLVPAPGWDARYDWQGFLDPPLTPREADPVRGWLATANQRIHAPDFEHFLTSEWTLPYRQQRIEQLLERKRRHTLDDLAAMQADTLSLAARPLLPALASARPAHPLAEKARAILHGFDGAMGAADAAPLVFWAWVRHLTEGIFADEVGQPLYERTLGSRTFRDALEGVIAHRDPWWCDDKTTRDVEESCQQQIDTALARALDELSSTHGDEPAEWVWGDAHVARSEHRPFSRVRFLAPWFELRTPVGGDTYTIDASRVSLKPEAASGALYLNEHGPSFRGLYDLGDPRRSRAMVSTGPSGIVFSGLYRSFVEPWAHARYVPLWADAPPAHVLTLGPVP